MLQYMQDAEYRLSVFNRFTLAALGSAFITPGPFSIFRAKVVREQGGWRHGHSTEDLEMALRMQNAGYLIGNAPGAVVYTGTPRTIRALFRQRVRWTYGFLRNAIDYRHMFGNGAYGNLGIIVLPLALGSIGIAIYFFARILYYAILALMHLITRFEVLGFSFHPSFSFFYINHERDMVPCLCRCRLGRRLDLSRHLHRLGQAPAAYRHAAFRAFLQLPRAFMARDGGRAGGL